MRQSEYTTFYERRGNVKYPVRGKLYMIHRGRAIYERDGVLTDGISGLKFPWLVENGDQEGFKKLLDEKWEMLKYRVKKQPRLWWRSKAGGVVTINGKVITTKEDTRHDTRHGQRN